MPSAPKISVLLPTHNRGYFVQNAITSILKQNFKDWELIIVDDGSTDNTERIVSNFESPRIRYIRIPKQTSISRVRNICAEHSLGELLVVQDSDDYSFPDRLFWIWKTYLEGTDIIYHDIYVRSFDPEHNSYVMELREIGEYDKNKLLHSQYIPGQISYTRKSWSETKYNESVEIADDLIFLLELSLKNYRFSYIPRPLYEYNIMNDSININAESDGRRFTDIQVIVRILKERYGVQVTGELKQWERMSGKVLKQQYV